MGVGGADECATSPLAEGTSSCSCPWAGCARTFAKLKTPPGRGLIPVGSAGLPSILIHGPEGGCGGPIRGRRRLALLAGLQFLDAPLQGIDLALAA